MNFPISPGTIKVFSIFSVVQSLRKRFVMRFISQGCDTKLHAIFLVELILSSLLLCSINKLHAISDEHAVHCMIGEFSGSILNCFDFSIKFYLVDNKHSCSS